ncbi:glycosyltransferase [Limosilactobacillus mucosae]|uniref:glycosyltransferase n=1 Tax=Limosilactobacillus mucosae TaxID=97478 RepID=UPI0039941D21
MSRQKFPNFSVLMSVYKNEKSTYLNASLKSIENQTVVPNEIILVEDGPLTKELYEVVDTHRNKFGEGFKVVVLNKNQGLGNALRIGTKYVSTKWIARMDTDDIAVPNRFELQLREVEKNPQLAVIGGQVDEFEGSIDNIVGKRIVPCSQVDIYKFIKWRSPFNHPTVMINKTMLEKVGGYENKGKLEDYFLWAKILAKGYPVINLSQVLVHMRVDSGMYGRRGEWANLKQIFKLRRMLYKGKLVSRCEELTGDFVMVANVIVPAKLRELIYKKVLHK